MSLMHRPYEVFNNFALVGRETGNLVYDLADSLDSGMEFPLVVGVVLSVEVYQVCSKV